MEVPVPMSKEKFRSWGIAKIYEGNPEHHVSSLNFHSSGDCFVKADEHGVIQIIDCLSANVKHTLYSKKYGVDVVRMAHHPHCVVYSSRNDKNDHDIRYHSFYDNRYLRYFKGHTARVTSLAIDPKQDGFISASEDGTIRLWAFNSSNSTGMVKCRNHFADHPVATYDAEGLVFAVYSDDSFIRLYDARNYQHGPFIKFSLHTQPILQALARMLEIHGVPREQLYATRLEFSRDGKDLLVMTNINACLLLDGYEGGLKQCFSNEQHSIGSLGAGLSPDGKFVAVGEDTGAIRIYDTQTGGHLSTFERGHIGPVHDLVWNPQRHMLVSAHVNTNIWIPSTPI